MPDNAAPILLLTRPRPQAERFAAALRAAGTSAEVLIAPMQDIVFLPVPVLPEDAVLIFTSENGVRAVGETGGQGRRAYCVGDRTARAAQDAGFRAVSAHGTADDLTALILGDAPNTPVVHLHGTHVRGGVVERLRTAGLHTEDHAVYDQRPLPLAPDAKAALTSGRRVVVPLFSPRSATLFATDCPQDAQPDLLCISAATKEALPHPLQRQATVVESPNGDAMLTAVARQLCH